MNCECGVTIPQIRLEYLPDTRWCLSCSDRHTFKWVTHTIYPHKTGGELFIAKNPQDAYRLERESKRAR